MIDVSKKVIKKLPWRVDGLYYPLLVIFGMGVISTGRPWSHLEYPGDHGSPKGLIPWLIDYYRAEPFKYPLHWLLWRLIRSDLH